MFLEGSIKGLRERRREGEKRKTQIQNTPNDQMHQKLSLKNKQTNKQQEFSKKKVGCTLRETKVRQNKRNQKHVLLVDKAREKMGEKQKKIKTKGKSV